MVSRKGVTTAMMVIITKLRLIPRVAAKINQQLKEHREHAAIFVRILQIVEK